MSPSLLLITIQGELNGMNTSVQIQYDEIELAMDKLWNKLYSKDPQDNLNYWEWVQGVALYGVIKAYEGTREERFLQFLKAWVSKNVDSIRFGSVNWVALANVLLSVHQQTGDSKLLGISKQVADWCVNQAPRTTNGGFAHVWGPGAGGLDDYKNQLWIDTLFMAGVFMLRYGIYGQDRPCIEEAFRQFDIHIECQFDPSCDLFYHGYHCLEETVLGEHWGRGNGWAAASLIELLDLLREEDYPTDRYSDIFKRLMESAYRLQKEDGMLRTLLDVEDSYMETSASALFAYAALKGYRLDILDERFHNWGMKIVQELLSHHLAADGTLLHASGGTDCQDRDGYLRVPYAPRPYNTGIMLMLLAEVLEGDHHG